MGTDPTYKEWKLKIMIGVMMSLLSHGSYLQGMETQQSETQSTGDEMARTDPTYKEWKLLSFGF